MNNIYKSKWSEATQTWVACSELVRGKTKNNCVKIAATIALALTSLGSYAADTPCDINAGNSVVALGTKCSLSDGTTYTEISASGGAELTGEEGKEITAIGTTKVKKVINVDGGSTLNATNITTTNKVNSEGTNALAIAGGSTVTIEKDLTAKNKGSTADTIMNSGESTLNVGKDLTIDDTSQKGFNNGIQNKENSTINVTGDINITSNIGFNNDGIQNKENSKIVANNINITSDSNKGNASIENTDGGKIEANNITITQGGKNYAIHQTSKTSSITVNKDLKITSGNIPEGNSTIKIEGGNINVKGKTTIDTHVDPDFIDEPEKISAISITDGTYEANGGANINIKDNDEENFKGAAGVIIGNEGNFINNGTLTVNDGDNTVIATDLESDEQAIFTNKADGITTSNVNTIVHNSAGTLEVNNYGELNSKGGSVLKNDNTGTIVTTNEGTLTGKIDNNSTGTITLNNKGLGTVDGDITNQNTGAIKITNENIFNGSITNNGDKGADDNIEIKNKYILNSTITNNGKGTINLKNMAAGTINGDITNQNTGAINITNEDTLNGAITNNGDKDIVDNIVIDNNHILNSTITNEGKGTIVVNNNTLSSTITGNITNNNAGTITLDNNGKIASDILNGNTGTIHINNNDNGTIDGSITNTGDKIDENTANILINNSNELKSTVNNKGKGTIAINNSGKANSSKITNSNAGKINITNKEGGTVNSEIINENTGAIKITNEGTLGGSIKNTGNASTVAADNIDITNNNELTSSIENNGTGSININNDGNIASDILNGNTGSIHITNNETFNGTITNTGDKINDTTANILIDNNKNLNSTINNNGNGYITVNNNNNSVIKGGITNSQNGSIAINNYSGSIDSDIDNDATSTGMIILDNQGTVNSTITNKNTGAIKITNTGTLGGSIKNTGTQRVVGNNWIDNIWIDNNKDLKSNIENLNGSIVVNNNKEGSSFTGNIHNNSGFNTGKITVNNNEENTKINSHITNDNGDITINNKAYSSTIEGDITNKNHGRVTIKNSGKVGKTGQDGEADTFLKITNSGGSINIKNDNDGDFLGNIDNDNDATGTGFIDIYNNGNTFKGSITNQNTGNISITNDTTLNSTITNTGDKRTNGYNIEITNNKELNGSIKNEGTGDIHIKNTKDTSSIISRIGRITGEITNNNTGTIILDNDGEIASAILNGGAGAINIANTGTLNGSITNTGDKINDNTTNVLIKNNKDGFINGDITNSGAGNISITNQDKAVLNGNIKNNGSGSITFTNNGDVDANVVNNTSVRINDTSLRQIQNTGNGTIIIINNKTLNRPISNASDGTIGITNNGTMETDITNNTESSEGGITFKNKQKFTGKLINANSGSIFADNQGIWNNTGNSVLTNLQNTTGTIIFPQVFETNAGDKGLYHTITVNGNYTGGGQMYVNTVWNKDGTSYSDRIDIHGDVDGAPTTVRTLNGIYGDVTLKEIPIHSAVVVHVAGKSSGNDFTGSAPTTNAGEAQLKKIDSISGTDYAWTLTAQNKTPEPTNPGVSEPTDPDKPILPAPPITEVPIYAEPVSGYVQMPTADMELGFTTIGTLHERRGENQTYNITGSNNTALGGDQQQTWGRVLVKHLDKDGKKRLDTAGNQSVLQIGQDFILDENEKTGIRQHIGGYVAYGHNENDFRDEYRAKNGYIVDDHYTGKGRTDAVSVGGYGTFYGHNGGYVDLVGQVTYLRNKYNARSNESVHQNGWGAALSAETGKSFIVYGNNWFVEPQAQLVYQYLSLDDFNDRIRHVDQHDPSALRGRVGMRFGYNGDTRDNLPSSSFYGIANIWHDFVNPKSVDIGRDSLKEEYAKTWGELGLGIQLPITRQSDFYSDIRYEKNFGSDKRKGFKGTMGYKYTWL